MPCLRYVGTPAAGVVFGQRVILDPGPRWDHLLHHDGKLSHRELVGVADVHRPIRAFLRFHQRHQPRDQIGYVAEEAGLLAAATPLPVPEEGEVRIRLEGCGVCASTLGPWAGPDWMTFPTDSGGLGHEGWGYVEKVGPGVQGLAEGQRVAFLGQSGFATHEVIDKSLVVPLPAALDGRPFPAEPLGCAMNIFRRLGISRGDRVAIVGIGFLGALLTRLASDAGAEVIAISRRDEALAMARQMGAARALPLDDAVVEEVRGHTNGRLCDVVIEAVGKQAALDLAGDLVAEGGRLVIAGYHQDGARQVNMQQWNWRGIDVINAHERKPEIYIRGIREAIEAVGTGRLDPWPLFPTATRWISRIWRWMRPATGPTGS